jgi:peptidylprolyl isomerase
VICSSAAKPKAVIRAARIEVFVKKFFAAVLMMLGLTGLAHAADKSAPAPQPVSTVPPATADNIWVLQLSTGGPVRIQLRPDKAPNHVARIKQLTRAGFYDGLTFHRVIEGFMAQAGDPRGDGTGGSTLPDIKAEFNDLPHLRGALSMARAESPDSANSQFFIVFSPVMRLDGKYTVFGRLLSGMSYVDAVARGEPPATPSTIVKAWIEADGPDAPRIALPAPVLDAKPSPEPVLTDSTPKS